MQTVYNFICTFDFDKKETNTLGMHLCELYKQKDEHTDYVNTDNTKDKLTAENIFYELYFLDQDLKQ